VVGYTVTLPLTATDPEGTPVPVITTDVAFWVVQDNTTGEPDTGENAGLELNDRICTPPTDTVTLAWVGPAALVAVKV
jgi:hypothetical protein